MKKNDWLLGSFVIGAALLLFFLANLLSQNSGYASAATAELRVCIRVDGEIWGTWPLDQDQDIEVELDNGYNRVRIQGQQVFMEEADCPDGYCMHQGSISGGLETIVCLPHKLVVEIVADDTAVTQEGVDTYAK